MFKEESILRRAQQLFGIRSGASRKEIRESYRRLSLRYHPDRNPGDPSSTRKMQLIQEAYELLLEGQAQHSDLQKSLLEDDHLFTSILPEGVKPEPLGESYEVWRLRMFYQDWMFSR